MKEALQQAIFLAIVNERLIEYFVAPLFDKFWKDGRWMLMYVSGATGGLLAWAASVDLLGAVGIELAWPGNIVLSALLVGAGSSFISELFDVVDAGTQTLRALLGR